MWYGDDMSVVYDYDDGGDDCGSGEEELHYGVIQLFYVPVNLWW